VKCMRSYGRRLQISLLGHDTRLICSAERVSVHYVTVEGNDSLVTSKLTYDTEQCERKNRGFSWVELQKGELGESGKLIELSELVE